MQIGTMRLVSSLKSTYKLPFGIQYHSVGL